MVMPALTPFADANVVCVHVDRLGEVDGRQSPLPVWVWHSSHASVSIADIMGDYTGGCRKELFSSPG